MATVDAASEHEYLVSQMCNPRKSLISFLSKDRGELCIKTPCVGVASIYTKCRIYLGLVLAVYMCRSMKIVIGPAASTCALKARVDRSDRPHVLMDGVLYGRLHARLVCYISRPA